MTPAQMTDSAEKTAPLDQIASPTAAERLGAYWARLDAAEHTPLPADACLVYLDVETALAEAGDRYLVSLRSLDDLHGARDRFTAVVDAALAATAGDPAAVRALVRQLVFDLAQARSEARR